MDTITIDGERGPETWSNRPPRRLDKPIAALIALRDADRLLGEACEVIGSWSSWPDHTVRSAEWMYDRIGGCHIDGDTTEPLIPIRASYDAWVIAGARLSDLWWPVEADGTRPTDEEEALIGALRLLEETASGISGCDWPAFDRQREALKRLLARERGKQ